MIYRINKKNENKISQLGYGCMRFPKKGTRIDQDKVNELIKTAIENGINYFDSAYAYPGSEEALGTALEVLNKRKSVYIATKLPHYLCKNKDDFDKMFDKQLERLKTDYIDYYLIHMLQEIGSWERVVDMGITDWIAEKIKTGKIRNIGFSFHGGRTQFKKIIDAYDWDFCMVQYNYLDENNQASKEGVQYANEKGLPVFIMEPLRGGMLVNGLPKDALNIFHKANKNYSTVDWGLRWLWNQAEVNMVLSGMSSMEQLQSNLKIAADAKVGDIKDLSVFDNVVATINNKIKVPCTGCNYCMPCPQGVDIPTCFSCYNETYTQGFGSGIMRYIMTTGAISLRQANASKCVKCGKCEKRCPQKIEITKELKSVSRRMESFWYKPVFTVVRKFTTKK